MRQRKPTEVPASLKNVDVKALLRQRKVYFKKKINQQAKEAAKPLARELLKQLNKSKEVVKAEPKPAKYHNFTDEEALAYAGKQVHIIEVIEKRFELKVQQFVTKLFTGFLTHLDQEVATKKLKKIKAKDFFDDYQDDYMNQAQLDFTPLLIDQAVLAGQQALELIKSEDIYTPDNLRKQIADNVAKFTQSLLETDRQKLIDFLSNGIEQGQSMAEIRNTITADFSDIAKNQAMLITRTEVARASIDGTLDAWDQSGLVEGKQWVVLQGGDECDAYDGQIETLDANFYADTTEFADGDPPLHPNCKCQLIPVLLDSVKVYEPGPNKAMADKIKELEADIDKRTKEFRKLKELHLDDQAYIKALEKYTEDNGQAEIIEG